MLGVRPVKTSSVLILVLGELLLSALIIFLLLHQVGKEKKRADDAEGQVTSAQAITSNVLTTMTIFNSIAEANQHAKEQIALDASGASADIRVAVANDDCAPRDIPASAVKRLQQYKDRLRQGAGGSVAIQPDS